jgi:hypothetical protein
MAKCTGCAPRLLHPETPPNLVILPSPGAPAKLVYAFAVAYAPSPSSPFPWYVIDANSGAILDARNPVVLD